MTDHLENVFTAATEQEAAAKRREKEHRLTELRDQFNIQATEEELLPTPSGYRLCLQEYLTLEWGTDDYTASRWWLRWFPPKRRGSGRAGAKWRRVTTSGGIVKAMNEWKVPREEDSDTQPRPE